MATLQRRRPPPPPSIPDHILELILVRLPPDDPSCLLRASLVCKHWRDLIYDPGFLLRLLDLRRAPQMLGFLHDSAYSGTRLEYVPTSPFSFPVPDQSWFLLGYRHGRAVFQSTGTDSLSLLVWVPFTGQRREVLVPADFEFERSYATVVCAADGCDHRNCYGGPFLIVFVFSDPENEETSDVTSACVYSSETGTWGVVATTVAANGVCLICDTPAVLVGKSLLYFLSNCAYILEYDLAQHSLLWIDPPHDHDEDAALNKRMILVQAEDDGLGIVLVQPDPDTHGFDDTGCDCLCLLSRKVSQGGDAQWVKLGVIYLEESLPYVGDSMSSLCITAFLIGFAEGENTVFVSTGHDIFTVELQSKRARKVGRCPWNIERLAPILSSYTSGSALQAHQVEHLSLMAFSSSDEADDEEERGEEDQAQWLFDKGLDAIDKGCFAAAVDYLSHTLELRVALYGELSPECASTYYQYGRALLKKSQKAANDFSIVSKDAPYEKTGEGTSNRADAGNSENRDAKEGQNSNTKYQEDTKSGSEKDDNEIARNGNDSDLDLAWKMLEVARKIVDAGNSENRDAKEGQYSNTKYQEDIKSGSDKDDNEIARNGNDSDLDLAWKMLEVARNIVEKSKVNSVETFRIVSALTEVSMEKSKRGLT